MHKVMYGVNRESDFYMVLSTPAKISGLTLGWARDSAFTLGRPGVDASRIRPCSGVGLSAARILQMTRLEQ